MLVQKRSNQSKPVFAPAGQIRAAIRRAPPCRHPTVRPLRFGAVPGCLGCLLPCLAIFGAAAFFYSPQEINLYRQYSPAGHASSRGSSSGLVAGRECAARQAHACPASLPAMSANLGQCSPGGGGRAAILRLSFAWAGSCRKVWASIHSK